jgi:hypothetical protein
MANQWTYRAVKRQICQNERDALLGKGGDDSEF